MSEEPTPAQLAAGLIRLLTVEKRAADVFAGPPQTDGIGRVFGGQVLAQALQAAQASVTDGKRAHSLHAYFLRGGREGAPIEYRIERDFDGRSFANRRVVAAQENEDGIAVPILNLTASFQLPEEGLEHSDSPMPDVPLPDTLRTDMDQRRDLAAAWGDRLSDQQRRMMLRARPIEMRTCDALHWMSREPKEPRAHSWFRICAPITGADDTPELHRAIITYASDYTLLGTSALPHGLSWMRNELVGASLDHALWFHRDARADEWLLYATDAPWSGGGRGFNRGRIFNLAGELVASVAQEGMMRKRVPKS
ncbi:acyl-CoA thioesterase [Erythrobacter neustonensis]|uniref:Acyl-CoA thioesterase II n=1 Tax=Erythrobacter neustonensis TaxID=1112 RepID=A0A192D5J0_9SPHN|nr:acyl-CoA thioesterase domain-containing protein [Erythrobacter neustonensis]ANK13162.1 acyl-CoA thioesterase II [Erythrobacter neustonensis]